MEVTQISKDFNRSLNITDSDSEEKYNRFRQQGKEAAQRGDLELSLGFFRRAFDVRPSDKMLGRIQRLEEAIKELNISEEEEEFVDVLSSGLMLYKGLYDQLYEHQKDGVAFLYSLHRDGHVGGILADDMGLGKTVQVISFLSAMYDAELISHTLLVMPTSLIKTWLNEFKRWTPGLRVKEFHGANKLERSRNLERIQRGSGAIITTYQMLNNNWQQLASFGGREFSWDYIILDEAHKIKSPSTKTAKSVSAVPSRHRLLLTGTPVQNNLREMWALFDFACKGALLGSAKTFKTEYENPITRAREKDATPGEKALGLKISQNLTELIKPYFLRRTKAEVQNRKQLSDRASEEDQQQKVQNQQSARVNEIPSLTRKTDLIVWTYLSDVQEDVYRQFVSLDHIKELLTTTHSPLAELTVLKKLCDHPRLLSARAVAQLGFGAGPGDLQGDDGQSGASSIVGVADETLINESGKLCFLLSLMESLRDEGKRTLIFSQSRKMLDIIERVLTNRKFCLLRVDGTITQLAERERRIALFQTDARYSVFLLTTQVGGVGLTLTAANRVVIFDPSWNPATDAQAVDRAYRIGQTHDVIIYRLITCGTVEEKIYRRQVFKDSLIRQTTGDKKNPFRYFTKQELKELFTLEDTHSSSTQLQLQSLHSSACRSDPELECHISALKGMNVFGVSRHDLLFSNEEDEDMLQDEDTHYIDQRVQKAQELVQAESQLHSLMMDNVSQNTEPTWLRLSRHRYPDQHMGKGDSKTTPPCPNLSSPAVVDLTQSGLDELDEGMQVKDDLVIDLSTHVTDDSFVEQEIRSINSEQGLIIEEKSDHLSHSYSNQIINISPLKQSDLSVALLGMESKTPEAFSQVDLGSPETFFVSDASKVLFKVGIDSSTPPGAELDLTKSMVGVESNLLSQTSPEYFPGNFNLQLEDSAELLSEDKEETVDQEEEELSTGGEEFQLQMDDSREQIESNFDRVKENSAVSTLTDESLLWPSKKKRLRVLYDSEEEVEKAVLLSSPLEGSFMGLGSSTPKSMLRSGFRRSMNTSIASRRSLVESLLDDMEEEEEEVCGGGVCGGGVCGGGVCGGGVCGGGDFAVVEEEFEEKEEGDGVKGFTDESTDVELAFRIYVHLSEVQSLSLNEVTHPKEMFDSLVHSGKQCLAEGRKHESLDFFLKAIDINTGDPEIQLLIIQLYRQLSH
ncbi:DNA excision repair protein ERCC-6-like [Silurus meridionalis]|uniref:DNA excision repair protein ERCC-6-like n=1 Tax=Silurus meridionalis TaxID=175797 RepID=UPI001EEBF9AC|nr:DNA excision repair protein ERCC-6-like [Silurus meridionalis]